MAPDGARQEPGLKNYSRYIRVKQIGDNYLILCTNKFYITACLVTIFFKECKCIQSSNKFIMYSWHIKSLRFIVPEFRFILKPSEAFLRKIFFTKRLVPYYKMQSLSIFNRTIVIEQLLFWTQLCESSQIFSPAPIEMTSGKCILTPATSVWIPYYVEHSHK